MALRKYIALVLVLAALTGCQPAKDQRTSIRVGRSRADVSGNRTANDSYGTNGTTSNKTWGEVTSNGSSQAWMQNLQNFASPSLTGQAQANLLGSVSAQSGQNTGVRFYGSAVTTGGNSGGSSRSFDPKSMLMHVEIYDDKAANQTLPPVVIEIAPDLQGFAGAGGTLNGSQVNLFFQDQYGTIRLAGYINGNTFSGNFGYCTGDQSYCSNTNNTNMLGQFAVDTCGFFQCN